MKFQTKLFLDRLFGNLICLALLPFVFLFGKILRIDHSIKSDNVKTIAVAKYFGLGSITCAVPMLKALKERYPFAQLIFISRKENRQLLELIDYIDKTFFIDDKNILSLFISSARLFFNLRKDARIDLFFDLEVFSSYGVLISLFSLARNRLGYFWAKSTELKTYIYTHLMYFNFLMPVRLSYIQLARIGGVNVDCQTSLLPFNLDENVKISADNKLKKLIAPSHLSYDKILAFNVNASDLSFARRWALENFAQTAIHFANKGYDIILLGSASEKNYTQKVKDFVSGDNGADKIYNAAGYFTLSEVLVLLPKFSAFLTNDTGLMNLAYAQNAKVAALYGNNLPDFTSVDNGVNIALYKKSYCSPCLYIFDKPPCGDKAFCMENIKTDEVICALETLLNTKVGQVKESVEMDCQIISEKQNYLFGTLRKK
ncbi:MAG: glycosyltransferase family 9 protein [Elusimicrobiota bacterium]|jgi:ADP-heptose:LPS heptosyltransferase|nr:glycosyltransferase family 9 protein [Elusimicrobiota bacterium]